MAAFVTFTTVLYQIGSPESRRPGATELVDADPRDFAHLPGVPWPVTAWRLGPRPLRALSRPRVRPLVCPVLDRARPRGMVGLLSRSRPAWRSRACVVRLRHVEPILVRVVPELAERVPVGRSHGVAQRLSAATVVAGIEAGPCGAHGDRPVGAENCSLEGDLETDPRRARQRRMGVDVVDAAVRLARQA